MKNSFDAEGTFGSNPCEKSLSKILAKSDNPKLIRKIGRLLMSTKHLIKQLNFISDKGAKNHFKSLLQHDVIKRVESIQDDDGSAVSHARCCLKVYFNEE